MKIMTASLYNQVGYYFSISHKVDLFIRKILNENIKLEYKLNDTNPDWSINLIVSTNSETYDVAVKGPNLSKQNKLINWGLWLPYKEITNSENPLKTYIYYFFEATYLILKDFKVDYETIRRLRILVEEEVLNNDEYEFKKESDIEIDLSDLKL